jgi:hypothetical protein
MAPIPIWKRVDRNKPVVKADRDFVGRVRLILDPIIHIAEQGLELGRYPVGLDADIAFGQPVSAGPTPDLAQNALVQISNEAFGENVRPAAECPTCARIDIGLLCFVEISACGDPCLLQAFPFTRLERGSIIGFNKEICHRLFQMSR